jgi:Putative prokaryotic signal transducing protein
VTPRRKVFSSNEISETVLVQDALAHHGVEVTIQNEYSGRSAVPGFRPPAEVWVRHDADYENARRIVVDTISTIDSKSDGIPWVCSSCGEESPQSFEMCWNCGREKDNAGESD